MRISKSEFHTLEILKTCVSLNFVVIAVVFFLVEKIAPIETNLFNNCPSAFAFFQHINFILVVWIAHFLRCSVYLILQQNTNEINGQPWNSP